ncbi:MAG: gamma-glutamylcyclotransferase [Eubacteriaceae bacterium]
MDKFFTQKYCSRCGKDLKNGRIMSMFNEDCICIECSDKEKEDNDYDEARCAELDAIKQGNYNFKGIRGDK